MTTDESVNGDSAPNLWARTMLAHGSASLRDRFLEPLLRDELPVCLLYSEPGAGSDLAAIQTTAERDGDEWVVNGQKVWTSGAREADYGLLIARTDWDQPKRRGITFFWFPMRQTGVEVRPLRQATGDARFNEVYLTDARVPDDHRFGAVGDGWSVLQTALAYEREVMGVASRNRATGADDGARAYTPGGSIPVPDLRLVDVAREGRQADDAVVRQALAALHTQRLTNVWTGRRAADAMAGSTSSSLASLGKLSMSKILHTAGHRHGLLLGAEAMLDGASSTAAADANYSHLNAYFTSIGGGTDQIQRNIIGERLLGLPREPEVDRDVPFSAVRRARPAD